jgi:hypothetical protein
MSDSNKQFGKKTTQAQVSKGATAAPIEPVSKPKSETAEAATSATPDNAIMSVVVVAPEGEPAATVTAGDVIEPVSENTTPVAPATEAAQECTSPEYLGSDIVSAACAQAIEDIRISGDAVCHNALVDILEYIRTMAPGKIMTDVTGAQNQAKFFNAFIVAANTEVLNFQAFMSVVLRLVHEHSDGAFSARSAFRFMGSLTLSQANQTAFRSVMNLLTLTADPKGRAQALKQVDMPKTLNFGFNDAGRNKMLTFFNV